MPQCPSCFTEMDYDAMMAHNSSKCRTPAIAEAERAVIEAAIAESDSHEFDPPRSDEYQQTPCNCDLCAAVAALRAAAPEAKP